MSDNSIGWRYFVLTTLFATFTSAVILADAFRKYEADLSVIVIPRNEVSAESLPEIVANMEHVATTSSFRSAFFERVFEKDPVLGEMLASQNGPVADESISVRAGEKGSVLSVRAVADDADDAKLLVREATRALFGLTGQYYNLKEAIDLRMTNGPIVAAHTSNPMLFVLSSIALGSAVSSAFFLLLFRLPNALVFFERRRTDSGSVLDAKVFEPETPTSPFFRDTIEGDREKAAAVIAECESSPASIVKKTEPTTRERKASAPENLPALSGAEQQFLQEFSFDEPLGIESAVAEKQETERIVAPPVPEAVPSDVRDQEPTEEEYKRRLNELLKG